jgi:CHAD domain-containing protein
MMTQEGMRDLQGGAQRWVDTLQRLAGQIQRQQQVSQQMTEELMNTYAQLLNVPASYLAELPQQQQQNFQQLAQQAMRQAQEQQRTLQQQAQGQQQNFQQMFQQTLDTYSRLFNVPASHAGESAQIAQESAQIVQRASSEVPIEGYDELNVEEIVARLEGLSDEELGRVREYERRNKNRTTLLEQIDSKAAGGAS